MLTLRFECHQPHADCTTYLRLSRLRLPSEDPLCRHFMCVCLQVPLEGRRFRIRPHGQIDSRAPESLPQGDEQHTGWNPTMHKVHEQQFKCSRKEAKAGSEEKKTGENNSWGSLARLRPDPPSLDGAKKSERASARFFVVAACFLGTLSLFC